MINKIENLIKTYKDICIITDFDYTLTDYSSYSSIGVFSNYLCKNYVKEKKTIDQKIAMLSEENIDKYYELWHEKILLLNKYANKKTVKKIANDNNFSLREELIELLNYANKENIDTYIISSGCKELIEEILTNNNLYYKNIKVIANSFLKPNMKIVTPLNKKEFLNKEYPFYILIGDNKNDFFIKENSYYIEYFNDYKFRILSKHENKKCTYGLGLYKDKLVFYKTVYDSIQNEIKGYKLVNKYYKTPNLITFNENIILYEYIEDFIDRSLYDYLYSKRELTINYNALFGQYKESLQHIKYMNETKLKNNSFFKKRLKILDKYINTYPEYKNIFEKIKNNISINKKVYAFISQGDPTDTNITINGIFCDFENGGYNSILGELAIFIVSILSHGAYIYPKYNSKVYKIKSKQSKKNKITIKNKELLLNYLKFYKNNLDKDVIKELDKYLKYYICFRIITPIDIDIMDKSDKELIFKELKVFYNAKNFNQIINIIERWNYEI